MEVFKILCILYIISLLLVLYFVYQLFMKDRSVVPMFVAIVIFCVLEIAMTLCK